MHVARAGGRGHEVDGEPAGGVRLLEQPAVGRRASRRCRAASCRAPRRRTAMVEAVPIVLQWPRLRIIERLGAQEVVLRQRPGAHLLAEPPHVGAAAERRARGRCPVSIGPPGTTTAGRSTDAAAMSSAGIVLSQPPSSTTPSIGLARSISSIAIAARLRQSIAVGRTCVSPSDMTGRFSGTPPASQMPCLTLARPRRGGRCRGSGRRRCSRWRCAGVRRRRPPAVRGASRPGGCRRCGPSPAYQSGCDAATQDLLPTSPRGRLIRSELCGSVASRRARLPARTSRSDR